MTAIRYTDMRTPEQIKHLNLAKAQWAMEDRQRGTYKPRASRQTVKTTNSAPEDILHLVPWLIVVGLMIWFTITA